MGANQDGEPARDVPTDPDDESVYECLDCGKRLTATSHPGSCPRCGAPLRNCGTPLE